MDRKKGKKQSSKNENGSTNCKILHFGGGSPAPVGTPRVKNLDNRLVLYRFVSRRILSRCLDGRGTFSFSVHCRILDAQTLRQIHTGSERTLVCTTSLAEVTWRRRKRSATVGSTVPTKREDPRPNRVGHGNQPSAMRASSCTVARIVQGAARATRPRHDPSAQEGSEPKHFATRQAQKPLRTSALCECRDSPSRSEPCHRQGVRPWNSEKTQRFL